MIDLILGNINPFALDRKDETKRAVSFTDGKLVYIVVANNINCPAKYFCRWHKHNTLYF